jgi:hypothetical protein
MIALEPDQKDALLKTLFDLHPSARKSITAILPSMTPATSIANAVSNSVYFGEQVAWCHEYLNNHNWPNNPRLPAKGSCAGAASVLNYTALIFEDQFENRKFREHGCNEAVFWIDLTIALLEIVLLAFERQSRLGPEHDSICERIKDQRGLLGLDREVGICDVKFSLFELGDVLENCVLPRVLDVIADGIHPERLARLEDDASPEELADFEETANYLFVWEAWHVAIRYSTRDNQSHPLRETLLKFIDLPPILPHPAPDDNPITESDDWLRPCLVKLAHDIAAGKMPDRRPGPVLDLGGMSIS